MTDLRQELFLMRLILFLTALFLFTAGVSAVYIIDEQKAAIEKSDSKASVMHQRVCIYHYGMFGKWPDKHCPHVIYKNGVTK